MASELELIKPFPLNEYMENHNEFFVPFESTDELIQEVFDNYLNPPRETHSERHIRKNKNR